MNLFIVYKEDYPWDVRVEKLAQALNQSGNNVTILASNRGQRPIREVADSTTILRLPITRHLPRALQKLTNMPVWFNPVWIVSILMAIKGVHRPILIVRDLPLVRAATLIARLRPAKLVLDMAEVYPEMYRSAAENSSQTWFIRASKNPRLTARYEQSVLPRVDHTLVMIEESRDRLLAMGVPKEKISIVSNTPPIQKYGHRRHQHMGETLSIVYVGFLSKLRGLDLLIEAVALYREKSRGHESIQLDIIGKGASKEKLTGLINKLDLAKSVRIHGWLPLDQVNQLIAKANIGALPYRVCGHWNHTIPNKLFDYMLAGLPVLATEVLPMRRIIEETGCGVVCRDRDPADIAEKLETLKNPKLRQMLGEMGYQAVLAKYNWESDQIRLSQAMLSLPD